MFSVDYKICTVVHHHFQYMQKYAGENILNAIASEPEHVSVCHRKQSRPTELA